MSEARTISSGALSIHPAASLTQRATEVWVATSYRFTLSPVSFFACSGIFARFAVRWFRFSRRLGLLFRSFFVHFRTFTDYVGGRRPSGFGSHLPPESVHSSTDHIRYPGACTHHLLILIPPLPLSSRLSLTLLCARLRPPPRVCLSAARLAAVLDDGVEQISRGCSYCRRRLYL